MQWLSKFERDSFSADALSRLLSSDALFLGTPRGHKKINTQTQAQKDV